MGFDTTTAKYTLTDTYNGTLSATVTLDITVDAYGSGTYTLGVSYSDGGNRYSYLHLIINNKTIIHEYGIHNSSSNFKSGDFTVSSNSFTVELGVCRNQNPYQQTNGWESGALDTYTVNRNWKFASKPEISNIEWSNCVPDNTPTNTAKVTFKWELADSDLEKLTSYSGHYALFRNGSAIGGGGIPFKISKSQKSGELNMGSIGAQPGDVLHFLVRVVANGVSSINSDTKIFTISGNATPSVPSVTLQYNTVNPTLKSTVTATWESEHGYYYDVSLCKYTGANSGAALQTIYSADNTLQFVPEEFGYEQGDKIYVKVRAQNKTKDKYSEYGSSNNFVLNSLSPSEAKINSVNLFDVRYKKYQIDFDAPEYTGVQGISNYIVIIEDRETGNVLQEVSLDSTNNTFVFPSDKMISRNKYTVALSAVSSFDGTNYRSSTEAAALVMGYKDAGIVNYELPYATQWKNVLNPVSSKGQNKLCYHSQTELSWNDSTSENLVPLISIAVVYYLWQDDEVISTFAEEIDDYEYGEHMLKLSIEEIVSKFITYDSINFEFDKHQYRIHCEFNQASLGVNNAIDTYECGIFNEVIYPLTPENASNVRYVTLPRSYQSPFDVTFEAPVCDVYLIGVYKVSSDNSYELLGESHFENSDILYDESIYNTQFYMSEIGILEENVKGNERVVVGVSPVNVVGNISDSGDVEVVNEYISNNVIYTDTVAIFAVVYQNINFKIKPSQTPENDNVTYPVWLVYRDRNGVIQTKDVTNDIYLCYMKTNWDDVMTLATSGEENLTDANGTTLVVNS